MFAVCHVSLFWPDNVYSWDCKSIHHLCWKLHPLRSLVLWANFQNLTEMCPLLAYHSCCGVLRFRLKVIILLYCIDTDEIPGLFLFLKTHIFIARTEDTIFIFLFFLSHERILVSPWLLTWLANYKRASCSDARSVLLKFDSQDGSCWKYLPLVRFTHSWEFQHSKIKLVSLAYYFRNAFCFCFSRRYPLSGATSHPIILLHAVILSVVDY